MRYEDIYANQKPEQEGKRKTSHQELALTAYNKGEKENREGRKKGKEWNKGEGWKKKGSDPFNLTRKQFEKGLTVFSSISQRPMSLGIVHSKTISLPKVRL